MAYSFPSHIHTIIMHEQLIILNERDDSYTILSESQTKALVAENFSCNKFREISGTLARMKLIEAGNTKLQKIKTADKNYEGIDNYVWRTNRVAITKNPGLRVIVRAYMDLALLKIHLARKGLETTFNGMRASKIKFLDTTPPHTTTVILDYARAIQAASVFLPFKVKCLESSICVYNYAMQHGIKCDFFIGVQLFDFLSHAWVEIDGDVVLDDKDLSRKIPTILSI